MPNKIKKIKHEILLSSWRLILFSIIIVILFLLLLIRIYYLQISEHDFFKNQGDLRTVRLIKTQGVRGIITDRNNEPLAVSVPVFSVWADPKEIVDLNNTCNQLSQVLHQPAVHFKRLIRRHAKNNFVYLKRHLPPDPNLISALNLPGVFITQEYQRYYPSGEVCAQLVGLTNIDDRGQEGMELAYDQWLNADTGLERVVRDRLGNTVKSIERIKPAQNGNNLALSIDLRLQYLAYAELKNAIEINKAAAGSIVLLDTKTGEILAMVNQPSTNPNNRAGIASEYLRNRAMTDLFEPGSTLKTFSMAAVLENGKVSVHDVVDTSPGWMTVDKKMIKDVHNYGKINLWEILEKSSNVGISKLILGNSPEHLLQVLDRFGFTHSTESGFPGEASGKTAGYTNWQPFELATLSFGYGISTTCVQLAKAYSVIANAGMKYPVTLLKRETEIDGEQVISNKIARQLLDMLNQVVAQGTAHQAKIPGYSVAGKTGTIRRLGQTGYLTDRHDSIFVGIAPYRNPRLVMVVFISDPQAEDYYGGAVAAPVYAKVMGGALRVLGIAPDDIS